MHRRRRLSTASLFISGILLALPTRPAVQAADAMKWHEVKAEEVGSKGWADTAHPFDRLPAKAKAIVRPPVWGLGQNSSGLNVRFETDADRISARWSLRSDRLAMPHMPATGVSGLDLYAKDAEGWHFLAAGQPHAQTNEQALVSGLPAGTRQFQINFPLYNSLDKLEIGVPEGASLRILPPAPAVRPVVVYGTSITQGGCASRPGMAYPAILGRKLGVPVINLGFSGNGKTEPEVAALLAELNPSVFVLDSLPNLSTDEVAQLVPGFLDILRKQHPDTPIVLVEKITYDGSKILPQRKANSEEANAHLRRIYEERVARGDTHLTLVPTTDLLGHDGESTVDGVHPTDLGFLRMADVLAPVLGPILESQASAKAAAR